MYKNPKDNDEEEKLSTIEKEQLCRFNAHHQKARVL